MGFVYTLAMPAIFQFSSAETFTTMPMDDTFLANLT